MTGPRTFYGEDALTNMIIGAGVVQAAYVMLTPGALLPPDDQAPDAVAALWHKIIDRTGEIVLQSGAEQSMLITRTIAAA